MKYPWQKSQWRQLMQVYRQGRLSHAYLLTGISGLGKADFAHQFAAILMCEAMEAEKETPCGGCKGCQLFHANTHPDFIQVMPQEAGHAIKIDQVRSLSQQLSQKPQRGKCQVVVIAPAEAMPVGAANALLKTLEEPLGNVVIFLVAQHAEQLPATIVSRCQQVCFCADHPAESVNWLADKVDTKDDLSVLLSVADGAPLMVKSLVDNNYIELRNLILKSILSVLVRSENPIAPIATWLKSSEQMIFHALLTIAMDLSRIQLGVYHLLTNSDCVPIYEKMAPHISPEHLQQWMMRLFETKRLIARGSNLNMQLVLEDLMLSLRSFSGEIKSIGRS